jgi:hypothetical protein
VVVATGFFILIGNVTLDGFCDWLDQLEKVQEHIGIET